MPVKTVFILGAGASVEDGAPIMSNFLDRARDLLLTGSLNKYDKSDFENVFKGRSKLTRVHSKADLDLDNLEALFSAFEMAKLLNKMPDTVEGEIDQYIQSLKRLIVVTLEETMDFPINDMREPKPTDSYRSFVEMINELHKTAKPTHDISMITFNYDIALDYAMEVILHSLDYCLCEEETNTSNVKLLKLHGSINWAIKKNNDKREILPISPANYTKSDHFFKSNLKPAQPANLRIGSFIRQNILNEYTLEPDPVIVPPSWNKSEDHNGISQVWQTAAKELGEAENIIVIGFSMPETDSFFKYLYALGTEGENMLRNFIVYDKQEKDGEVDKRYQKLLGPGAKKKYVYRSLSFNNAIKDLKTFFKDGDFLTDKQIIQVSLH